MLLKWAFFWKDYPVAMKLIIFDCDGTIVDSQHAISAAMVAAFEEHGLEAPARSRVLGVVGLSLIEAVERLLPESFSDDSAISRTFAAIGHPGLPGGWEAHPGIPGAGGILTERPPMAWNWLLFARETATGRFFV